jgi:hypothetical protein
MYAFGGTSDALVAKQVGGKRDGPKRKAPRALRGSVIQIGATGSTEASWWGGWQGSLSS